MNRTTLKLDQFKTKDTLQPRIQMDFTVELEYADEMRAGRVFPPVEVVYDGENYWLWDGWHRIEAARMTELEEFAANVTEGSFTDAEWLATGANTKHGFRRTKADKRRAVGLALELNKKQGRNLSASNIARHCGVSHNFVAQLKKSSPSFNEGEDIEYLTKHGTPSKMKTANLGKRKTTKPKLGASIVPDVIRRLFDTDVIDDKAALAQLDRLDAETQEEVAALVVAGEAKTVKAASKRIKKEKQIAAIETATIAPGQYHVVVVDPPWRYKNRRNDPSHRAANPYPDMTIEEIKALEIPAHDDCILWLWTTNAFMEQAHQIAQHWDFEVKTILTWVKDKMGLGDWLRGKTEHCLMCVKGSPVIDLSNQTTVVYGPLREHSRKPDEFYELVDTLCVGEKIELFAREQREGWSTYGNETTKFNGQG